MFFFSMGHGKNDIDNLLHDGHSVNSYTYKILKMVKKKSDRQGPADCRGIGNFPDGPDFARAAAEHLQ